MVDEILESEYSKIMTLYKTRRELLRSLSFQTNFFFFFFTNLQY